MKKKEKALVVFSGGQDSTTCLGWAIQNYDTVEAITFAYKQRHQVEIQQAKKICDMFSIKQKIIGFDFLDSLVDSALLSDGKIDDHHPDHDNLSASFVPNRNALFLTLAHAYAQTKRAKAIVTGVCQTDYSGYPDCRQEFIDVIQAALNIGSESKIVIHTPLMHLSKAGTFALAEKVGIYNIVIEESHTCYEGDRTTRHDWGYGCGECPACKIRKKGWKEYKQRVY